MLQPVVYDIQATEPAKTRLYERAFGILIRALMLLSDLQRSLIGFLGGISSYQDEIPMNNVAGIALYGNLFNHLRPVPGSILRNIRHVTLRRLAGRQFIYVA